MPGLLPSRVAKIMKKKLKTTENPLFHQRKITDAMKVSSRRRNIILIQLSKTYHSLFCLLLSSKPTIVLSPEQGVADRSSGISVLRYSLLSSCQKKLVRFSQLITDIISLSFNHQNPSIYASHLVLSPFLSNVWSVLLVAFSSIVFLPPNSSVFCNAMYT